MRPEIYRWIKAAVEAEQPKPPVLEVGARNVNGSCRDLFPQDGYLGIDLQRGAGVDLVLDILQAGGRFDERFRTVLTTETLEHIRLPWQALRIMRLALMPGGLFLGSWPFIFPLHDADPGQCGDYLRASPQGFAAMLEWAGFDPATIKTEGLGVMRPEHMPCNEHDWQYPTAVMAIARVPL